VNIREKIFSIQKLARKVPKRGRHERGWTYVRIEDVVTVATRLMSAYELILTPNVASIPAPRTSNANI